MLALSVLIAVLAAPSPSPTPAPPLKEIVHVRASAFCSQFAHHANGAIDSATRNDIALGSLISSLRSTAFSGNTITRNNAVQNLQTISDEITRDWKNGESEVGALRKLADQATNADEKKALVDSANALGGALWRQRKIARDLDGFVAYLHARDMSAIDENQAIANQGIFGTSDPRDTIRDLSDGRMVSDPGLANEPSNLPVSDQAAVAARDFETRLPDIIHDEISAAEHVTQVSSSC